MTPVFIAHRKFDPTYGETWSRYIEWTGFYHIHELVSTDSLLCPSLIDRLIEEDWDYNIHEDNRIYCFHDYQYLKRRINYDAGKHNILAIVERPSQPPDPLDEFSFCGYDILDSHDSISVLTNCGGFPSIFSTKDINDVGLIPDLEKANTIAEAIRRFRPDDNHCCDCRVWAISRYVGTE